MTWPKIGKGRNRKSFTNKNEAETFFEQKLIEQRNYGTAGTSFTESQRAEYLECSEKLRSFGVSLRDATDFYLPHLLATNRSCTIAEFVTEFLAVKEADGASKYYLTDLRSRLGNFAAAFNGRRVAEITGKEVDEWLRSLRNSQTGKLLAPTTRNNFRRVLIVAFSFANQRGYCVDNPAKKTAKAKEIEGAVGILTVEQVAAMLEKSAGVLVPYVAIGAFAGLRSAELERLDWREIDLDSRLIEVTAKNAKSARRRFVKIQPNLAAWLTPHQKLSGRVAPVNCRKSLEAARAAAEIQVWPQNALRHSFASYHLAHFNDAAALAIELGHTSTRLVFQHYRQLVRPKEAKRFWAVCPASGANIVHFEVA